MSENLARFPSLDNRSVFISGGATGIGATLVERFALQGAKVCFVDLDTASGETLADKLEDRTGTRPWFQTLDVTDIKALQASILEAQSALGDTAVLINNVANDTRHSPEDVTEESWNACMSVNLDASFFSAQAVLPAMKKRGGGSIINFSSINALLGPTGMPGYVTAKAGLIGMTRALARDYGQWNIRVNAILPGWVVTERQLDKWLTPEAEAEWMKQVALPQRLLADDVASLTLFLAADDSKMITGQCHTIDGGRT